MSPTILFGDREYSHAWMMEEVGRILAGLHGAGVKEGDTVSAMLRNSPEYVALVLACRQAGLFLASINWHFKALEANHILVDSQARALFVDIDLVEQIRAGLPENLPIIAVPARGAGGVQRPAATLQMWADFGAGLPPMPARSNFAHGMITYTSGTTGKPKGVRRIPPQQSQAAELERRMLELLDTVYGAGQNMTAYLSAPMYHSAVMMYLTHCCRLGARIALEPRFDAERALQLIARHRVTHAYLAPTMYQRLLALDPDVRARYDVSSLTHVASTGSPCPVELKKAMIDWFGPVITEAYGSSEAGYTTFIDSNDWLKHPGSAGQAMANAKIRILDEQGVQLPPGEIGLIYVRQEALPDFTYINQPQARQNMERDGCVTLGDMGYLDADGFLFICDRKADMVISGGVNIYPAEIEGVLQTMPDVVDCAVFGVPDAEFGESVAAAVQLRPGSPVQASDIQQFLRERIANYKVPRVVEIHESLPREDTGKIFKRVLREPHWRGQQRKI
ncbi:MAG: AMP-binding protein [Steroidobacteraceae bacterium]|nr:AMP-binding protein [Steroidobacteraceae bacterium]